MNKLKPIILLPLVVLATLVFHFFFSESSLSVQNISSKLETVSDQLDGGNSLATSSLVENGVEVTFTLKKSDSYPFAGTKLIFDSIVDVSDYTSFCFDLKGSKSNYVPVVFGVQYRDKTQMPVQFVEAKLHIDSTNKSFDIPFNEFEPPAWWLNAKGIDKVDMKKVDFSKLQTVGVSNGNRSKLDDEERIYMTNMFFKKRIIWPYYLFGISFVVLLILALKGLLKKKESKPVEIVYQSVENKEENSGIIHFISTNYMDNLMSSQMVQTSLGVSESRVSNEVKNHTGLSFKQFLNQLRIEEAKRLLELSDLRVNEVADKVGYDNVTHFNRTFKTTTGQSPTAYRKAFK